jgi:hypothetical protein
MAKSILLTAMVGAIGWGIRGRYGHDAERNNLLRLRNRAHLRQPADRFPRPAQLGLELKS